MHVILQSNAQCMNIQLPLISLHSACPPRSRQAFARGKRTWVQHARQPDAQSWMQHARRAPIACASAATDQVYKAISDNQEATITVVTGTQLVQEVRPPAILRGTRGSSPALINTELQAVANLYCVRYLSSYNTLQACNRHGTAATASAALGRLLMGTVLLAAFREEQATTQVCAIQARPDCCGT